MKKLLVLTVALASVNAFATRARYNALAQSPALIDTQTVYTNPSDIFFVGGDYATIESGATKATNANDGAEGMVVRSMGDSKMGLSLGHDSDNVIGLRGPAGVPAAIATQQNPIELTYGQKAGDVAWAGTLVYSNYKDKTAVDEKENSLGLRGGMRMGAIDASLRLGLANEASTKGTPTTFAKFKGTLGVGLGGGYQMDTVYFNGDVALAGFKTETSDGTEIAKFDRTTIKVGATNEHKKDGNNFFYGVGLNSVTSKTTAGTTEVKTTELSLPVWMGLEVDAASWLVLRGSVTQTVLINDSKTETTTPAGSNTAPEFAPGPNNTKASVGAGLKFNKVMVDGSLTGLTTTGAGAATQNLSGNELLGQVGLTYMF